jgi:chromosome segregation ATPase
MELNQAYKIAESTMELYEQHRTTTKALEESLAIIRTQNQEMEVLRERLKKLQEENMGLYNAYDVDHDHSRVMKDKDVTIRNLNNDKRILQEKLEQKKDRLEIRSSQLTELKALIMGCKNPSGYRYDKVVKEFERIRDALSSTSRQCHEMRDAKNFEIKELREQLKAVGDPKRVNTRDWFAGQVIAGIMQNRPINHQMESNYGNVLTFWSKEAYKAADAMMEARK